MQTNIFKNYFKSGLNHKILSLSRWNTIIFLKEDPFKVHRCVHDCNKYSMMINVLMMRIRICMIIIFIPKIILILMMIVTMNYDDDDNNCKDKYKKVNLSLKFLYYLIIWATLTLVIQLHWWRIGEKKSEQSNRSSLLYMVV